MYRLSTLGLIVALGSSVLLAAPVRKFDDRAPRRSRC